jgi:hypothetical protein
MRIVPTQGETHVAREKYLQFLSGLRPLYTSRVLDVKVTGSISKPRDWRGRRDLVRTAEFPKGNRMNPGVPSRKAENERQHAIVQVGVQMVECRMGARFPREKRWFGPEATLNQRHVDFVLLFRDQEAVGSNPIAPTISFRTSNLQTD